MKQGLRRIPAMGSNIFVICLCTLLYDTFLAFGTSALSCFPVVCGQKSCHIIKVRWQSSLNRSITTMKTNTLYRDRITPPCTWELPDLKFQKLFKNIKLDMEKLFPFCTPRTWHNDIKLMIQSKDAFIHLYVSDYTAHIQRVTTPHTNSVCYWNGGLCWEERPKIENKDLHSPPPYESIHLILLTQTWAWSSWKFKSHNTENEYLLTGQTHSTRCISYLFKRTE